MKEDTLQIVLGLRRREPQALEQAYHEHKSAVLAAAAATLSAPAPEAAWDVLHDVFIALARAAPNLKPDTNLRAYLIRAAVNRARSALRGRRALATNAEPSTEPANGACKLEQDEQAAELLSRVAALPEEQRTVVSLRIWGELSFVEIAAAEGISENTAQSRYRYALEKLRRHYLGVER